jgi:hypothetical protein
MNEIWKPIPGYESRYEVSNLGRVRSFVTGTGSKGEVHYLSQDISDKRGYRRVTLCVKRKVKKFLVHRLVATAFIGPPPTPEHDVNHIDYEPSNNHCDNLEWLTTQGNHDHSISRHPRGVTHGMNRLSEDDVRNIRALHAQGGTQTSIALQFGISQAHCQRIVTRGVWKHI